MCDIIIYSALKVKSTVSSGSVSLLALFLTCRFTNKHTPPVLHTSTCPRSRCGPCLWLLQHHAASLKHCLFAMPMLRAALALPHCVPVLSAGHTRKSRVTVSSLARFFLFEPVEQDLRAPVTGVCASSPPPPAQIIRGNVATQSLLSL